MGANWYVISEMGTTKIKVVAFDYGGVLGSDTDAWETNFQPMLNLLGLNADRVEEIQSQVVSMPLLMHCFFPHLRFFLARAYLQELL